jgi:hypothetical protein
LCCFCYTLNGGDIYDKCIKGLGGKAKEESGIVDEEKNC